MLETALAATVSKLTGTRLVITHHGDLILPGGLVNRFIQGTMFWMYKIAARRASKIIAYSQDYADHSYYLQPFMDKVVVNYPPVRMPPPNPQRVAELRAEWSREGGPIIGFAHRFVEEKRPDLAIQALEIVNQTYPNARLVFAGDYQIAYENTWERQQELVNRYKNQLHFLGLLTSPQDVADFYAACDVLLLTSDSECFALAQVEAMLGGTPVVATNIPGGRVPVTVTGMGKLAAMGDWRSIGEAVVEVLSHPNDYRKPRQEIEEIFSFKDTVDRYEQLFTEYARGH